MSSKITTFHSLGEFRTWRTSIPRDVKVGFVPTMGALHDGHISLVKSCQLESQITVVSIFVNPSQFAPNEDLDAYPRTLDEDLLKLETLTKEDDDEAKRLVVLVPNVQEMYPSGIPLEVAKQKGAFVSVLGVSEQLEGKTRPNFFRGVATVVTKLFNVVQPDHAYFGQKDIQQTIVLRRMVKDLLMPLEIRVLPIVREGSGLAMSSRNTYLSPDVRERSKLIYQSLAKGQELYTQGESSTQKIIEAVKSGLEDPLFKIDYISVADKEELQELTTVGSSGAVLSVAVYVHEAGRTTRLIDNIIL